MKQEIISAAQIAGTPAENVKHYTVEGSNVLAEFWTAEQAHSYMRKYAKIYNGVNCIHTTLKFADFELLRGQRVIKASSTYHNQHQLISMFEAGLKY